ncbi:hypothetical protein [Mesorhizobium sp. M2A.F.Ca.ET.067.02.1.1]|uniref:hypothetical protein n=1 Tax=Mesorhizobium sp. M2A.F.Ca.ET.067.02.1.1 TaxID=2496749 RepID=UPI001FE06FD6|nr:hypothetical protein [Mesorhizobium sp. M2A.F.Ca.ET.067.02.1.1]
MSPTLRKLRGVGFAVVMLVVLLVLNVALNPARFQPSSWGTLLGLAAPLIGAAVASAPVILAGRGGIDISAGPLMGFVNALVIQVLFLNLRISSPRSAGCARWWQARHSRRQQSPRPTALPERRSMATRCRD